jgi:hypothetical protein
MNKHEILKLIESGESEIVFGNNFFVELEYREQKTYNITPVKTIEITEFATKILNKIIENNKMFINKMAELGIRRDTVA